MARLISLFIFAAIGVNLAQTATEPSLASISNTLQNLVNEFEKFKDQLNTIESRLMTLQKSTSADNSCWVRNIAEAIRTSQFTKAEQELMELNNDDVIPNIVHDVYSGSSTNVKTILDFARSLRNGQTKFAVFNALRDEMRSNGYNDPLTLITLTNELQRLSRLENVDVRRKAQPIIKDLLEDIKSAAISTLRAAMIANKFQNNAEVETLANALFDFRADVSNEVMEGVVDKVFGIVAAETIIDNISSYRYTQQVITGLAAVFNRFNFAANLNNNVILKLASDIRKLQSRENYATIGQTQKDDVNDLIHRLPLCVSNYFFAEKVCLWNKGRNMYLYAADSSTKFDTYRRSIFMQPGEPTPAAYWIVEQNGTDIFFKNIKYKDEYLYPAGITYDNDRRFVFTWIPGHNKKLQSAWAIELDEDVCYLKSMDYKEYLYAPSLKYNDLNSYVFTSISGKGIKSIAEYQWQVRNCTRPAM